MTGATLFETPGNTLSSECASMSACRQSMACCSHSLTGLLQGFSRSQARMDTRFPIYENIAETSASYREALELLVMAR